MANEISLSVTMSAAKGGANESVSASAAITMINEDMVSATMVAPINTNFTTSIAFSGAIHGGLILIKNLSTDTTVVVEIAKSTAAFTTAAEFTAARILSVGAGEVAVWRTLLLDTTSLYRIRTNSATVTQFIQVTVLEP